MDNTNLIYALAEDSSNIGNIRETFFLNQLRVKYEVSSASNSDFLVDDMTFENGGKRKGQKQIRGGLNLHLTNEHKKQHRTRHT